MDAPGVLLACRLGASLAVFFTVTILGFGRQYGSASLEPSKLELRL